MDEQLLKYRTFFQNFLSKVDPADQLPVKVIDCNTTRVEASGAILDWILQYLNSWNCPQMLVSPLAKVLFSEVKRALKTEPFFNEHEVYSSLHLMQYVVGKIQEVFRKYGENEELISSLCVPNRNIFTSTFANKNRRRCMEDCHVIVTDLQDLFDIKDVGEVNYYAVFDGHNGSGAAMYSAAHLHQFLAESPFYPLYPEQALSEAFKATDKNLLAKEESQITRSGTTAVCILWHKSSNMLYSAWVGDSEAVLAKKGKVFRLVNPHKANRQDEIDRIRKMGGVVLFWSMTWRVNGQLAITRAIGDSEHKPSVISTPDVGSVQLEGDEDFVIIGCDGLWDSVSHEDAVRAVYKHIASNPDNYDQISQILVHLAKSNGSDDNITVIVVFLSDPRLIKVSAADMETATAAESFSPKQNGTNYCTMDDMQGNFVHGMNEEDDFGPETNVDNVDDGLISQSVSGKKTFTTFDKISNPFEAQTHNLESDSKKTEIIENEKNALSDESDDEEWNYIKGEENSNSKSNSRENTCAKSLELNASTNELESPLNPDAAEFVPLSPTALRKEPFDLEGPTMESLAPEVRDRLLHDDIVASSPLKGQEKSLENVDVPSLNDFDNEIRKRPSNIMNNFNLDSFTADAEARTAIIEPCPNDSEFTISDSAPRNFEINDNSSTYGNVGNESSFTNKLCDFSDDLKEKSDDETEKESIKAADAAATERIVENGNFETEDYPSIVEHRDTDEPNATHEGNMFQAFNNDVNGHSERRGSLYDEVVDNPVNNISHMMSFHHSTVHPFINTDSQTATKWDSNEDLRNDEKTTVSNDLIDRVEEYTPSESTNPFMSIIHRPTDDEVLPEKENADEKEVEVQKSNEFDYTANFGSNLHDFNMSEETPAVKPADERSEPTQIADVEEVCIKDTSKHDVQADRMPESTEEQNQSDVAEIERSLSLQIEDAGDFEAHKFSGEEVEHLEDVIVLSDNGDPDEPIRSVDVEAPYIHDCSRLDEKPDSVHHHPVHEKHYDDLLPDTLSTMESDKLESELRESLTKAVNELPVLETKEEITPSVPTTTEVETTTASEPVPSVPEKIAEAVSAASDIAKTPILDQLTKETKKSTVAPAKKDEKAKPPAKKPTPATTSAAKTKTSTTSTLKSATEPKKTTTSVSKVGAAPRTISSSPRPASAAAKTATAPRTMPAAKPSPKPSSPAAKPTPKPGPASPAKPKLSTTRKSELPNGDVSKPIASKRVSTTTSAPPRKPETSGSAPPKPAVNLSTRTSLAPKPRPTAKVESSVDKARPATTTKRPLSSATKVPNKDTKDVTNKRLSTTKSNGPLKSATATNGKTEFKSGVSKSTSSPLKTGSSTAIKKPASASPQTATNGVLNQSDIAQN